MTKTKANAPICCYQLRCIYVSFFCENYPNKPANYPFIFKKNKVRQLFLNLTKVKPKKNAAILSL